MKPTKAVFSSPVIGRKLSRRAPTRCCAVILMLVASVCSADSIRDAEEMTARFLRGNRRTFNSKGHPKSLGMEIEFQYPSDWRCSEGVRPHVVVSVASDDPIAPLCHLQIVDFAESFARELQVPASEIRKQLRSLSFADEEPLADIFFSEEFLKAAFEAHALVSGMSCRRIHVDKWPGAITTARITHERVGVVIDCRTTIIHALYKNCYVCFYFSIPKGDGESETTFRRRCQAYEPLLLQVANSIVIHDQYR